jgi:hypothetical protein
MTATYRPPDDPGACAPSLTPEAAGPYREVNLRRAGEVQSLLDHMGISLADFSHTPLDAVFFLRSLKEAVLSRTTYPSHLPHQLAG